MLRLLHLLQYINIYIGVSIYMYWGVCVYRGVSFRKNRNIVTAVEKPRQHPPKIHYTPTVTWVNLELGEACVGRTIVLNLTYTELKVLRILLVRQGTPVTVQTLLQNVWRGVGNESRSKVVMAISRLRTKLKKYGVKIKAVHGEGYYL